MLKNDKDQDYSNAESLPEQRCSSEQRAHENESSLEHETANFRKTIIFQARCQES